MGLRFTLGLVFPEIIRAMAHFWLTSEVFDPFFSVGNGFVAEGKHDGLPVVIISRYSSSAYAYYWCCSCSTAAVACSVEDAIHYITYLRLRS